jgi:uncharacterized membrane protein YgcG
VEIRRRRGGLLARLNGARKAGPVRDPWAPRAETAGSEQGVARWLPDGPAPADDEPAPAVVEPLSPAAAADPAASRWLPDANGVAGPAGTDVGDHAAAAETSDPPSPAASRWSPWPGALPAPSSGVQAPQRAELAGSAVSAYCRELRDPGSAQRVCDQVLEAWHADASHAADDDAELLALTRAAATERDSSSSSHSRLRGLVASEHREECDATEARLVARAAGVLTASEAQALETHLDECARCQATELKLARAERAFATVLAGMAGAWNPPAFVAKPAADVPAPEPVMAVDALAEVADPADIATDADADADATLPRRRRALAVLGPLLNPRLAGTGAALIAIIVTGLLLLSGHAGNKPSTSLKVNATTPAPTNPASVPRPPKRSRHHAARRRAHKPAKHATKPASPAPAAPAPVSAASAASSVSAASSAPVSSSASSAPAPSSSGGGGSGGGGGSSGGSVVVSPSSLPAQSAPTQGIGSGSPKH